MGYYRAGFDVVGVDMKPQPKYPFQFIQADAIEYLLEHGNEFDAIHASPPCQIHCALKSMPNFRKDKHLDLIPQTRAALIKIGKPYVIENVPGAPLIDPIILCGSMFGLQTSCGAQLRRHRLFETNWYLMCGLICDHKNEYRGGVISVVGQGAPLGSENIAKDRLRTISVHGDHARDNWISKNRTVTSNGHSCQTNVKNKTITVTGNTAQQNVERNVVRETFSVKEAQRAMGIDWMGMSGLSQAIPPAYTEFIGKQLMQIVNIETELAR